tara:strand:+ start:52 stop:474 length:423 start_codon:yes stop_codon:yes gene_type:complete
LKVNFKGVEKLQKKNKQRMKDFERDALRATAKSALVVKAYAQEQIQRGTATGRPRGDGSFASAPGQFPKTDTGVLVSNISTEVKQEGKTVVGKIISSAPYSKHLEFGTTNMAARPFMQPSLDRNADKIKAIFIREGIIDK